MEHSIPPDLKDQLQKQKWFHGEFKTQLKRLEKLNKITFDLSKNNLITLSSPILTPELKAIATRMALPNRSKVKRKADIIQFLISHQAPIAPSYEQLLAFWVERTQ